MKINMYFKLSKIYKTQIHLSGLKINTAVLSHANRTGFSSHPKIHHAFHNSKPLLYFKLYRLFKNSFMNATVLKKPFWSKKTPTHL